MPFAAAKLPTFALRHRIRSDLPPRGGIPSPGTKREREISSIGGQQCHIVRSVRVRIASGRQLSMQRESGGPFIPPKGEETRVGGVGIPRPGLMEIEGRTECFSS